MKRFWPNLKALQKLFRQILLNVLMWEVFSITFVHAYFQEVHFLVIYSAGLWHKAISIENSERVEFNTQ